MLALPHTTSIETNQVEALRNFAIAQQFVDASNEELFSEQANVFQSARDEAVKVQVVIDEISLTPLLRYHDVLSVIVPKLKGYDGSSLSCEFSWFDPFQKKKSMCKASCLYYEWSNVLWNIAAFESFVGAKVDRSNVEGIKRACKCFQVSAGIFDFISKETLPHVNLGVSSDKHVYHLTYEALEMAKNLMLSQAQLCFYEMAVKERKAGNMRAPVVAKIACQSSNFFAITKRNCEHTNIQLALDPTWKAMCEFNAQLFAAAADYWQSQAAKEANVTGNNYGEEVIRLSMAYGKVQSAVKLATDQKLPATTSQAAHDLLKVIETTYVAAEEDNRTVYMSPLPAESDLPPVGAVAMVRPAASLPSTLTISGGNSPDAITITSLFSFVVPSDLRMKILDIQTKADEMVRKVSLLNNEANNDIRAKLGSLGLPGALEACKEGDNCVFPESLWNKVQRIQGLGGVASLHSRLDEVDKAALKAQSSLKSILSVLQEEEAAQDAFKVRLGNDASGADVTALSGDIRAHTARLQGAHTDAREKDSAIRRDLVSPAVGTLLQQLNKNKTELDAMTPRGDPVDLLTGENPCHKEMAVLEELLVAISGLLDDREEAVKRVEAFARGDLSSQLIVAREESTGRQTNIDSVADELLEKEGAVWVQAVQTGIEKQEALFQQVLEANEAWTAQRKADRATLEREKVVTAIETAVSRFSSTSQALGAASTFYANLQSRAASLVVQAQDLALSRQLHRQQYEEKMVATALQEEQDREMARKVAAEEEEQHQAQSQGHGIAPAAAPTQDVSTLSLGQQSTVPTPPPQALAAIGSEVHLEIPDMTAKTVRLVEMGFDIESVKRALQAFHGDEQAAAEAILMGTPLPPPTGQVQSQPWSAADEQQFS